MARPASGTVFITDRVTVDGGFGPATTREYSNGKFVASHNGLPLVPRENRGGVLFYDRKSGTVTSMGGRIRRSFNPCRDPYNGVTVLALSPTGDRGVCIAAFSRTNQLVLFTVARPRDTARVIFRSTFDNPQAVTWIDEHRIAVMELQKGRCPYYHRYGYAPTNLAIIDLRGRILKRGPCMAGVMAGSKGLIYLQLLDEPGLWGRIRQFMGDPLQAPYFSVDGGRTWHPGSPAFQDGSGETYYWPDYASSGLVVDENGGTLSSNAFDAQWTR